MMWMIIFWGLIILIFVLYLINRNLKKESLDSFIGLLVVIQLFVFLIAIATKDPIFQNIGLPVGYEWIAGLILSGFSLWSFYLNPLKKRVNHIEINVSSIKTDVENIKGDVSLIKNRIIDGSFNTFNKRRNR